MFPQKKIGKKCNLVRFDVSLHTIIGPPRQVPSHPFFSFLAYYMGAPSDQFLRIEYGGPLRSVSSLIMEASLCLVFFSYYMGAPQIISLHTILGPPDHFLRLLWRPPYVCFFFILYRGPSSGVVGNFLLWERLHRVMFTYPIVIGGGGGWGSRMNGSLSRVKIYVQLWRFYFLEIMGRYCSTSLLHFC